MQRASLALPIALIAFASLAAPVWADDAGKSPAHQQAEDHALKAQAYFKMGRFSDAEAEFKLAEGIDPSWHELLFDLGVVYQSEGKEAESLAALKAYLPYAADSEAGDLKVRIAALEIKLDDARKVKEQQAAEAQKAQAEAQRRADDQRAAAAEAEARAQAAADTKARALTLQSVTFTSTEADYTMQELRVTGSDGVEQVCPTAVDRTHECRLGLPPGPATMKWKEFEGTDTPADRDHDLEVPKGNSRVAFNPGSMAMFLVGDITTVFLGTGGLGLTAGGIAVSLGSNNNGGGTKFIAAGVPALAVGLGLGIPLMVIGYGRAQSRFEPVQGGTADVAQPHLQLLSLAVAPTRGGAALSAGFSF